MHLPYPPGNLKLNTITFPSLISVTDIIVTWATRNRFTQTIGLVDYYSGSLTSEPGVTYTGELRRIDTNGLLLSFDGVTGTTTTLITMINVPFITLTNSGTLATVTTSAAHGLVTGRKIVIISAADAAFNGTFVITVLNSTSFTYTMSTTPTLGSSGAIIKASLYAGNVKFTVWSVNANGNSFQRIEHTFTLEWFMKINELDILIGQLEQLSIRLDELVKELESQQYLLKLLETNLKEIKNEDKLARKFN